MDTKYSHEHFEGATYIITIKYIKSSVCNKYGYFSIYSNSDDEFKCTMYLSTIKVENVITIIDSITPIIETMDNIHKFLLDL